VKSECAVGANQLQWQHKQRFGRSKDNAFGRQRLKLYDLVALLWDCFRRRPML